MSDQFNVMFNLRLTSKQFAKQAQKFEKKSKQEKAKVAKAIKDNNLEGARIYAENAIREHNMSTTFLRYSSRLDGVASRLRSQQAMGAMVQTMGNVCKSLQTAADSLDMKKVSSSTFIYFLPVTSILLRSIQSWMSSPDRWIMLMLHNK